MSRTKMLPGEAACSEKQRNTVLISCIIVMILWGSLFPCIKLSYRAFGTDTEFIPNLLLYAGVRFTLCGSALSFLCKIRGLTILPPRGQLFSVGGASLTSVVLHYACTYIGLTMTDSGKTAILKQICAVIFICISSFWRMRGWDRAKNLAGALIGFCGILLINFENGISLGWGEILIFLASACTVATGILSKKVLGQMHPLPFTACTQLTGGLVLLTAGLLCGGRMGQFTPASISIFAYICLASIISYSLWYGAVRKGELSYLFIIKMIEPLFASVFGALLMQEDIGSFQFAAAFLCIILAIYISRDTSKEH